MKKILYFTSVLVLGGIAFALAQPMPGGPPGGMRPPLIVALDTDSDGEISAEEIKKSAESLKTLDKNEDGKLTEEEYRPQRGTGVPPGGGAGATPGGRPEGRGPGRPGEGGEAGGPPPGPNAERMVEHAFEFDEDKDGKLSREELKKFAEDFAKHHAPPGGGRSSGGGPPAARERSQGEAPRSERPRRPE